ncbi:MAG: 3'(2'),5'-bisphosphate nucleotidase CysQ [Rhodomicrobium sp.]
MGNYRAQDFDLLREAAASASKLALSFWGRSLASERKADGSAVSEADRAVDALLASTLRKARPDYGWLSEESPEPFDRLTARRVFIVDPIDGTRSFLRGGDDWTVAISIAEDHAPAIAVITNPVRAEVFEARAGAGAFMNGRRIFTSSQAKLSGASFAAGSSFAHGKRRLPWPNAVPIAANSSLYRLALVASGRADASFSLKPKSEWDIAAGALLVSEAGGKITSPSGEPLKFNSASGKVPGFVAAALELHEILIEHLSSGSGAGMRRIAEQGVRS